MKKFLSIITAVVMVCMLCVIPASAESAKLNKTDVNLPIGYAVTLKAENCENVKWSSGDETIAKIKSADGNSAKIVGVKTGSAYIYAKTDGKTLKCRVTVKKSFITPKYSGITMDEGAKMTVSCNISGSKKIAYNNSDKDVCSVSAKWSGNKLKLTVKAKEAGTAKIKIYAKGYSKSTAEYITVKVKDGKASVFGGEEIREELTEDSGLSEAEKVVELVNEARAEKGLDPLVLDEELTKAANARAEEIITKFSHTRPDGTACYTMMDEMDISYGWAGENIAAGQRNADDVMDTWINSQGHYENIMGENYKKIGVGLVKTSSGYKAYWVQIFTD